MREVPEGGMRAPCIGCAGRFLGLGARPLAALLEVRFVQAPHSATGTRSERLEIRSSYIERATCKLHRSPHRGHLCLSDPQFFNLHLWLEPTRLPYAGYDHILSKQIGAHMSESAKRTKKISTSDTGTSYIYFHSLSHSIHI